VNLYKTFTGSVPVWPLPHSATLQTILLPFLLQTLNVTWYAGCSHSMSSCLFVSGGVGGEYLHYLCAYC
jgi:hypothetical protein